MSLPHIMLNMAMSADGKIATANRKITSFGSDADHAAMLDLRAAADAVLCGARTADSEPVTLCAGSDHHRHLRRKRGLREENLRIVASPAASLNPKAKLFTHDAGEIIVLVAESAPAARIRRLQKTGATVQAFGKTDLDLPAAMRWLKKERAVKRLVCEGGPRLNDAMLRADLVDELRLTICPVLAAGKTAPTIADGVGFNSLNLAALFRLTSTKRIGDEQFLRFVRDRSRR